MLKGVIVRLTWLTRFWTKRLQEENDKGGRYDKYHKTIKTEEKKKWSPIDHTATDAKTYRSAK
jgi:hypothetical protein